jgi:cytidine deaminase
MTREDLIDIAYSVVGEYRPSRDCASGLVGAAILTRAGNVYTGVCIDTSCSLGFCAEHSALAEMLKHRESEIAMIVAVNGEKQVAAPCGRCREFIYQVNRTNVDTDVVIAPDKSVLLQDLLPYRWQETWKQGV